jgi:hypothetical protein
MAAELDPAEAVARTKSRTKEHFRDTKTKKRGKKMHFLQKKKENSE